MTDLVEVHEPVSGIFTAYVDPEGITGTANTREGALMQLAADQHEALCDALSERDKTRRCLSEAETHIECYKTSWEENCAKFRANEQYAEEIRKAAITMRGLVGEAARMLDQDEDVRCLKLLLALAGRRKYRADVDAIHDALDKNQRGQAEKAEGARAPEDANSAAKAEVPGSGPAHPTQSCHSVGVDEGANIDKVKSAYVDLMKAQNALPQDHAAFKYVRSAAVTLYDAYDKWFHAGRATPPAGVVEVKS